MEVVLPHQRRRRQKGTSRRVHSRTCSIKITLAWRIALSFEHYSTWSIHVVFAKSNFSFLDVKSVQTHCIAVRICSWMRTFVTRCVYTLFLSHKLVTRQVTEDKCLIHFGREPGVAVHDWTTGIVNEWMDLIHRRYCILARYYIISQTPNIGIGNSDVAVGLDANKWNN